MTTASTSPASRVLRFDADVLGKPQDWVITYRGLEYRGKVVVAETVNPAWGQPLEEVLDFRLVFYTVPRRVASGQIRDPRIAIAVPKRAAASSVETLGRELSAIAEAKARYTTSHDLETQALRASMEDREATVRRELGRRYAVSYSQGRIYTFAGMGPRPSNVFISDSIEVWADQLLAAVFEQAYPSPLFDHNELPSTLTVEMCGTVFRGLFQADGGAAEVAAGFGPALGLSTKQAPGLFDASSCRALDVIRDEVEANGGEAPTSRIIRLLCISHGLNRALATLYLLAFLGQSDAEIELSRDHSLQLREGGLFPGDRVTWDLIQEFPFSESLNDQFQTLRARPPIVWNVVLPYATLIAEELEPTNGPDGIAEQEHILLGALDDLGRRAEHSREGIANLGDVAGDAADTLDRLQVLCAVTGFRGFHEIARGTFGGPAGLRAALDLYRRLDELSDLVPAITQARLYLDQMTFRPADQELSLERQTLVVRLAMGSLIASPSTWHSVEDGFQKLQRRYFAAYIKHHAQYHREAVELRYRLESLRPQVEALARLNEVPEFGGPLASEVPGRFADLMASIRACDSPEGEITLETLPHCQACLLPLSEEAPRRETDDLFRDVEIAMREYNRHLSSEGVRRVLADPTGEQLDKFISLVQVSDPSALANVLDDEVIRFLRAFVRGR